MHQEKKVLITGSSGFIGRNLSERLVKEGFHVIGLDRDAPKNKIPGVSYFCVDITSPEDMEKTLLDIKHIHGEELYSVMHLVAYYSFSGEKSKLYNDITIEGTRSLMDHLWDDFKVRQFIFSSSMLAYAPVELGEKIKDNSPLAPSWPYPQSKVDAEKVIREEHDGIPVVNLRIAGVYDDFCHSPTLSNQIMRIYEKWVTSFPFPGNPHHGQAFLHVDDLCEAITLLMKRDNKSPFETFVIGEEEVVSYKELQEKLGMLLHKRPWPVIRVPKAVAQGGAFVMAQLPFMREPFIKPWMIKHSDEHFAVDMSTLKEAIHWKPKHSLRETLPVMIDHLKEDPDEFYKINKLKKPFYRSPHSFEEDYERNFFFLSVFNMFIGLWLVGNVFGLGEVGTGEFWSQIMTGSLVSVFSGISLFPTLRWMRWINATLGCWLLFSPLVFHTPSAAAYVNDTLLGGLLILTSSYSPAEKKTLAVPKGWSYNPSTAGQRIPIMLLAFLGFMAARYMTAFQLGHISEVWDPFFPGGTEKVLTSKVSKAFPIPDAGLGALTYLLDIVAAGIGGRDRWRSLPWAVILFGFMIIPAGVTSITLVMLQPISVGAWCTLCLFSAFITLVMVPPAVDEVLASYQFLKRRKKAGESVWKVFWLGSNALEEEEHNIPQIKPEGNLLHLYFCIALSIWLMFCPYLFGLEGLASTSTYIVSALAITFSIIAMSEVARIARVVNVPLGVWLIIAPWFFDDLGYLPLASLIISGVLLTALSLPRGKREERFGETDKIIHWTPVRR